MPDDLNADDRLPDETGVPTPAPSSPPAPTADGKPPAEGAPEPKPTTEGDANAMADAAAGDGDADKGSGDAGTEQGDEAEGEGSRRKRKPGYLRRAERAEAERDHWRDLALRGSGQPARPTNGDARPAAPASDSPPRAENFDSVEAFQEAQVAFQARKVVGEQMAAMRQAQAEAARRERSREILTKGNEKYGEEFEDFLDLPVPRHMADAIMVEENAHDIAMHLGRNPELAHKLSRLHPLAVAAQIGRIAARLESEAAPAKPAPRQQTPPPPPPRRIGGGSPTTPAVDPNAMSTDDYIKWRNKGGGA